MAVPDFQTLMRPMLVVLSDGVERSVADLRDALSATFELSDLELEERLPSGRAKTFNNRVGWATTYLYRCRLLSRPTRSVYAITQRGMTVLEEHSDRVDLRVLSQFPEFDEFRSARSGRQPRGAPGRDQSSVAAEVATPEERIAAAERELRIALAEDLRDRILDQPPEFLEQLVLDVLNAMGYGADGGGGTERLGQSGDEGIDGVVSEDALGLDRVYVQAKRWALDRTVGRPEIQRFVGALQGQQASKGVFITTSSFSPGATDYASRVQQRVVLIDGSELARLMIKHDVGVSTESHVKIKRADSDYFSPESGPA